MLALYIRGSCPEIIEVAHTILITSICDNLTIVDWCFRITARNVTIKHTVHHHGTHIIGFRSICIITYDTTNSCSSCNSGIAETVDDTGRTIKLSNKSATDIAITTHFAIENSNIINAATTIGSASNRTRGARVVGNANTTEVHITHRTIG